MSGARSAQEVLVAFTRLGLTSFGGPIAHIGYFRAEFVARRRWLDEGAFADLVALCQFLPGPASSQLGMAIGLMRAGRPGMLAAWVGFTLPSAILMILAAFGVVWFGDASHSPWLRGLRLVAVAVVAQAVWGMARSLCPDRARAGMAVGGCVLALLAPGPLGQIGAIVLGAAAGLVGLAPGAAPTATGEARTLEGSRSSGWLCLVVFAVLLVALPAIAGWADWHWLDLISAFFRAGALVFGGGHVVLPLLQSAVEPPGWVGPDAFLAGYGVAQAMPGPLFTFAAYLGAVEAPRPNGALGGLIALVAIFLPSALLVLGALPFWDAIRVRPLAQAALRGTNAAVVGVLLAALFTPIWTGTVVAPLDFAVVLVAFTLLVGWSVAPWAVVIGGAVFTGLLV